MAEQSLGLESVPFFKKPLDASESDRIVGQDDAGNFVYQTFLGNKYTVARDPDQRTTRTKIEEDVIPAVKAYAKNPRLPTGEEVVGAGKAIVEGAVETASIPGDLLTGKRSPTSVQMGDVFDIAGGAAAGASTQTLPDNAVGSMVGAFRRKDKPSIEVSFDPSKKPVETITLGSPITPYVETMDIPKKGITGKNFLADIRKNLKVPVRVFQDDFIEGNKRYTREELLKLVEEKEFKVKAQEQGQYSAMQRQNQAGFTYGDEQEYFFMNIAATTGAGKIIPRRQHASSDDIGHVRGSIITPSISSNFDANTETIFDVVTENKPILLAEEFQSDLYQKGYKTTNPDFIQQEIEISQYGRLSKEVQKIIADSSTAANKANIPAVYDYDYIKNNTLLLTNESIERTMKDATDRGYIGGDTFDSVSFSVDRLKDTETDAVFKGAYLDPERIEKTVRRFAEEGVSINLPETETFREEMFIPPMEFVPDVLSDKGKIQFADYPQELEDYIAETARSILKYREKIADEEDMITSHFAKFANKLDGTEVIPKQAKNLLRAAYTDLKTNTNDFQGLDAVTPPINKVKSVTDEMLKTLIVKAATSGVDKIVIPPTDRLAAVRFEAYKESPPKFLAIMDKGLPASIQEFKKSYPEVNVSYNVEMPYDNSMYPPGSNIPSNEGTVIDLKEFLKKYNVSPEGEVRQFAQGGVAMKDQMEMNFGKAETVDPVSGNDVPPGSLPIEVRDDIPARLSEGEYVVPADVVRYFGVRVFEQMRAEAKMGLQQMDADGRIGGEPIEPQQAQLSDDDLNSIIEQAMQQEQPMMANEGGVVGYKHGGYHAPDYVTDFLGSSLFGGDTSANEFYNVDDYKPTTGEYGTPEEAEPAVTVNVPDPVCPPGQVYNRAKQMCVPKEESDGPPPSGDETTASTSFGLDEEGNFIDFTDPEAVLEYAKSFDTPVLGGALGDSDTLKQVSLAGSLAGIPAIGAVAGLASLGNKIGSTTDIAGLRAARMTAAIYGHDDVVKQIESVIAGYEGGTGFTKGGKFGDAITTNDGATGLFGTGYGYGSTANGANKKDLKTFMKMYDDPKADKKAQEKLRKELEATSRASREERLTVLSTQSSKSAKAEEKKREIAAEKARKAAQAAAQVAANKAALERVQQVQKYLDNKGDGPGNVGGGGSAGKSSKPGQVGVPSMPTPSPSPAPNSVSSGSSNKEKEEEDYGFGDAYNYKTGGLVQKRKKKKK